MRSQARVGFLYHYSCFFLDLCENIEVAMERLKMRHSIFVIEASDYNLILS